VIALLDPRMWLAAMGLVALGAIGGYVTHWRGESARWEARVEQAHHAAAMKLIRTHERQQEAMNHAHDQAAAARRDADAAAAAAGGLRDTVAGLRRRATAACSSPAAASAFDLLADLQRRADEEAVELARYADAARIAGQACERAYESLTPPKGNP
jgi:hypothetical protein